MRWRRVLFCVQNLTVPDDPRVWREARDLAAAGIPVCVVCPSAPGRPPRERMRDVEIYRYPSPPEVAGLVGQVTETLAAIVATLAVGLWLQLRGGVAVLHAANPPDAFFVVAWVMRLFGTKFVFDQHDVCPELLEAQGGRPGGAQHRLLQLMERASYQTAQLVVVPNDTYRSLAIDRGGVDPDRVVVVRSGPDELEPVNPISHDDVPIVAFAGTMDPQDGVHLLVEAAATLLRQRPGALRVDLIGRGRSVEDLRRQSIRLGIGDAVTFPGWLSSEHLRRRLASAAIAVSPDEDTPFTRLSTMTKVTDYLGLGLPSVVSDLPENRVTGGDAVVYYPPGDAAALARCVEELLARPDHRDELARQARERAPDLLWRHSRKALLDAYDRVLGISPS